MNRPFVNHSGFSLLLVGIFFTSCNGQNESQISNKTLNDQHLIAKAIETKGDTVKELCNNIMIVYQDKKENYWFGSWEEGLYRYDGKKILHFTTKDGLCQNNIGSIQEDKAGNMYFQTNVGINMFDGKTFTTLSVTGNEWKLQPGDLWFTGAQDSGVVYRYDGKILHRLKLSATKAAEEFNARFPRSKLSFPFNPYDVYTIYNDSQGNVWFGTAVLGACRYDGKTIDWISEEDVMELHNGPANGVRSIIEDKDGYFWFNSMYRYKIYGNNTDKKTFYSREKSIGSLDEKKDGNLNEYLSIAKDNNNELWIATYTDGIWRYNGKDIIHYPVKDGTKDITVFSIYKDNKGDLWLGTHENGAYKFNGRTFEKFKP
jgi:ligand-binding sensor domain-containing protein